MNDMLFFMMTFVASCCSNKILYGLNESLNIIAEEPVVYPQSSHSKKFVKPSFSFVCPDRFVNNGTHCIYRDRSSCPEINTLKYRIVPYGNNYTSSSYLQVVNCSYSIEDILKAQPEESFIKLELFWDTSTNPFNLYLDVTARKPISALKEKISCWWHRYLMDRINIKEIFQNISFGGTYRFVLEPSFELKSYFCHFLYPSKMNPVTSNFVYATNSFSNTYTLRLTERSGDLQTLMGSRFLINNRYSENLVDNENIVTFASNQTKFSRVKNEVLRLLGAQSFRDTIRHIAHNQFCPLFQDGSNNLIWPKTKIGTISYPVGDICLDNNSKVPERECRRTVFGAEWSKMNVNCSSRNLPIITSKLIEIQRDQITKDSLLKMFKILEEYENVRDADLLLITNILSKPLKLATYHDLILNIVNKIFDINSEHFSENAIDTFFTFAENAVNRILRGEKEFRKIYSNVEVFITQSFLSFFEFNSKNINVSMYFNTSHLSTKRAGVSIIIYNTETLFSRSKIIESMVDIKINEIVQLNREFQNSVVIRFRKKHKNNLMCVYWDAMANNWSSLGIATQYLGNDVIRCESYHLTRFSLLIISQDLVEELTGQNFFQLDLFSTIESLLSILGVLIILIIAIFISDWRKRRWNIIHLSFTILIEHSLLVVLYFAQNLNRYCVYVGAIFHLLVLVKFCVMLLIAKTQLGNFVQVLNRPTKIPYFEISAWIIPSIIVTISVSFFSRYINGGKYNFCFPKEQLLLYSVVLPISLIVTINSLIFVYIMCKISIVKVKSAKKKTFQFKLAALLWILLGGTWIFSIFVNILPEGTLQLICFYTFCFVAPLQGFFVFIFYVILDKSSGLRGAKSGS